MGQRKLPADAFEHYLSLGVDRSYRAVAEHFGVTKVTVVNRAKQEHWQDRLREIERQSREHAEKQAVDEMDVVRARQLKESRVLQARAIQALKDLPPEKGLKVAAAALQIGWKQELLLLGEATERSEVSVEEITKREMQRWLVVDGDDDAAGAA